MSAATELGAAQVRALHDSVRAAGLPHELLDRAALVGGEKFAANLLRLSRGGFLACVSLRAKGSRGIDPASVNHAALPSHL